MKGLILLACLIAAMPPAWAVTPETGTIARLEAVVANLRNTEINRTDPDDLALLQRIGDRFAATWEEEFMGLVADQQNPTAVEKAGFVLLKLREYGISILRNQAQQEAAETANAPILNAGETAAQDLEEAQ